MSKYKERGPYHFVEYADPNTEYHAHASELVQSIRHAVRDLPLRVLDATGLTEPVLSVHEVGCGEGLLLHLLQWHLDRMSMRSGNDADPIAVRMGNLLVPGATIELERDWQKLHPNRAFDAVMFCDSLEHMERWKEHVQWAERISRCVIIAVPSKPDRHAIQAFGPGAFRSFFDARWEVFFERTRHSRHVTIWRRK